MKELTPAKVMEQVANAVPAEYRTNIIIVGSLAAGFHFFGGDEEREVRTKDIDCLLSPHDKAINPAKPWLMNYFLVDGNIVPKADSANHRKLQNLPRPSPLSVFIHQNQKTGSSNF